MDDSLYLDVATVLVAAAVAGCVIVAIPNHRSARLSAVCVLALGLAFGMVNIAIFKR